MDPAFPYPFEGQIQVLDRFVASLAGADGPAGDDDDDAGAAEDAADRDCGDYDVVNQDLAHPAFLLDRLKTAPSHCAPSWA